MVTRIIKSIVFCIVLISTSTTAYAQDDVVVTVPMNKWQSMEDNVRLLNDSIVKQQTIISSKDTLIANQESKYTETIQKLQSANSLITKLQLSIDKMKADSISTSKTIGDLRSQLTSAKNQLGRVDTMAIQMIITYMNLKCSDKRINTLRTEFANISNNEIKTQYKHWDNLLAIYPDTYKGLRNIVLDASGKIPSASMPALRDRYIAEAEQKIGALQYVQIFYSNNSVNSPYLNSMIQEAKELLKPNKSAEDFSNFLKLHP